MREGFKSSSTDTSIEDAMEMDIKNDTHVLMIEDDEMSSINILKIFETFNQRMVINLDMTDVV